MASRSSTSGVFLAGVCCAFTVSMILPRVVAAALAAGPKSSSSTTKTNTGPPCYIVIEAKLKASEIKRFGAYAAQVPALVSKFGGRYLVLGGTHTSLEGDWETTKLVLHKWPNAATAHAFWTSPEYQALKQLRQGTGDFRIMLLEGLEELPSSSL